ncbi:mitoguardin domain-containing protein [Ditylenchus destructor]|nr:mitoguardin domain-containing protein [Ditylenchus destructor]
MISAIKTHPKRSLLIGLGIGISVITFQALWRVRRRQKLPRLRPTTLKLSENIEIDISAFNTVIDRLECLLTELEPQKFQSDVCRGRYDLIVSIISRLRGICDDLQKYLTEDFRKKAITEEIARTVWSEKAVPRAGTLSVFSDDSFATANDEQMGFNDVESTLSLRFDTPNAEENKLYNEGLKEFERGHVRYRKSRAQICGCDSERDFAAKLYCVRKAFKLLMNDDQKMHWLTQSGRALIADLLRHDGRDPGPFYMAYDRMMQFLSKEENHLIIEQEMRFRKVEQINLWDVLFDFVILDAFDDLKKPPSAVVALVKNSWFSKSMKESTLSNLIWSLIKVKRSKLQIADGFISHFYDISQILTTSLTMGLMGGTTQEFEEICTYFKDNLFAFIADIFNVNKVRFTTVEDLREDIDKLMTERVEVMKVKLTNELLPS